MALLLTNFAQSTINAALTSVALTVTVTDGARFPSPTNGDWFPLVITSATLNEYEIVKATGRSGNVITIEREQEGTTARAFSVGDDISLNVTKAAYDEFARSGAYALTILNGINFSVNSGTSNALVATVDGITSLQDITTVRVRTSGANTSTQPTLNLNGLGVTPIYLSDKQALVAGNIQPDTVHEFTYSTEHGGFIINNPRVIPIQLTDIPVATTSEQGKIRIGSGVTFNVEGNDSDAMTQKKVSQIVQDHQEGLAVENVPFQFRNTGNGSGSDYIVANGETPVINTYQDSQFASMNIQAGGTLNLDNSEGVAVLRIQGDFIQSGNIECPRSSTVYPIPMVGPRGGRHPSFTSTQMQWPPQGDPFGRGHINVAGGAIGVTHIRQAIESGLPLQAFHGGSGAAYGSFPFEVYPNQAGGGLIIIADSITINAGAETRNMHSTPGRTFSEVNGGSGNPYDGPSAGGFILYASKTLTISDDAEYELGSEGTLAKPQSWSDKQDISSVDNVGAGNGQVFHLSLSTFLVTNLF